MTKCYYDLNDLECQEVAYAAQQNPTPENLNSLFLKGHLYVYDASFLRDVCLLKDNASWFLFELAPYKRLCQFDYVASLAIEKYINEAKAGEHNNTNLDAFTQIVTYAACLSPNSSIEIDKETEELLKEELGNELFDKLFYKDCETQILNNIGLKFLNEILPDQVFYREDGQHIKLARISTKSWTQDKKYIIEFDLIDNEMMPCFSTIWSFKELTLDDFSKNWQIMGK